MFGIVRTIGLVIIAIIATVFCVQNLATIEVAFFTWSVSAPRALIFLAVFGMGLIAGYLVHAFRPRRQRASRETEASSVEGKARGAPSGIGTAPPT